MQCPKNFGVGYHHLAITIPYMMYADGATEYGEFSETNRFAAMYSIVYYLFLACASRAKPTETNSVTGKLCDGCYFLVEECKIGMMEYHYRDMPQYLARRFHLVFIDPELPSRTLNHIFRMNGLRALASVNGVAKAIAGIEDDEKAVYMDPADRAAAERAEAHDSGANEDDDGELSDYDPHCLATGRKRKKPQSAKPANFNASESGNLVFGGAGGGPAAWDDDDALHDNVNSHSGGGGRGGGGGRRRGGGRKRKTRISLPTSKARSFQAINLKPYTCRIVCVCGCARTALVAN